MKIEQTVCARELITNYVFFYAKSLLIKSSEVERNEISIEWRLTLTETLL